MRLLLDSHTFLWYAVDSPDLLCDLRTMIDDPVNTVFVSIVSVWELSIKNSIGKLDLKPSLNVLIERTLEHNIAFLPIRFEHIFQIMKLPFHHRDLFDRIIIAQGIIEECAIISRDAVFDQYEIRHLWN